MSAVRWLTVVAVAALLFYQGRRKVRWSRFARELGLVVTAYLVYFFVRVLTEGSQEQALNNASRVIELEKRLFLFHEEALQALIIDQHQLVTLVNWIYIWGHWPVIGLVAAWLYMNRPGTYPVVRNAFLISGGIGLVIFATFPVAPPRFTDLSLVDTVTEYSRSYRLFQPPEFSNIYAAVPSLHFGWNLLIGIVLVREAPRLGFKVLGVVLPLAMFAAIVLTANHFVIDAVFGAAVALAGLGIALSLQIYRRRPQEVRLPAGVWRKT
jgi:hypothetical protein